MVPGQSLSQLTSKILVKLENLFSKGKPQLVLAHGDTTTCFTTAIASFYHQIPFYHVEAGLRSNHLNSPFPEEFNRQTIAPIAQHHFAPTVLERQNLLRDGVNSSAITITGSTIHDAIQSILYRNESQSGIGFSQRYDAHKVVVVTLHRRESMNVFEDTLTGLKSAALERPDVLFVCPVHPNPRVQTAFKTIMKGEENIILTEPLIYSKFIPLLLRATLVVTDSGGVQEEAAFLNKPVLLARNETERTDGLSTGLVEVVGTNSHNICASILRGLAKEGTCELPSVRSFARKSASQIITDEVMRAIL
jgi:UDP-N-acetylglucosamine 2-epimerase (non-hydrolysing)